MSGALATQNKQDIAFHCEGHAISCDGEGLVSLTDLWKAAGSPTNKQPQEWSRKAGADFIDFIAQNLNTAKSRIYKTLRGKGVGGTYAHWQIALAYAKYLSHEFHASVNAAYREWKREESDPGLKMTRAVAAYKKAGRTDEWIASRFKGISQRNSLMATMADHNCKNNGRRDNAYAEETRAISLQVLGKTPREIKSDKNLPAKARTRDHLDRHELARLFFAESEAELLIKTEACDGNSECVNACRRAGEAVQIALKSLASRECSA